MRIVIVILAVLSSCLALSNAKIQPKYHTVYWKNAKGHVVYEGNYKVSFVGRMPVLKLFESFCYGPFAYKCMAPEKIDHGNGIFIRNYLPQPTLCWVPAGYKVCLQPAYVQHGPIEVLPYLYLDAMTAPCKTAIPKWKEPVFYRPAPLLPVIR